MFPIKENQMPKKLIVAGENGAPTGVIAFKFEDGTEQTIDVNSLSEEVKFRLMVHGASQKIGDSYAGAKSEPKPVEFAKTSVMETIKQLVDGLWRVTSPGGPRVTDLATAYAQVMGETLEAAVELVGTLNEEEVKALRAKPRIKAALLSIAATRAAEKAAAAVKAAEADEAANQPA